MVFDNFHMDKINMTLNNTIHDNFKIKFEN